MRILHVVPTYLPARRYGGPIYAVHGLAKALAARGHHVDVFTTNVDGDGVSNVPVGTRVELDGVGVHYFASSFRRLYWSAELRKALEEAVTSYDVVHLHSIFLHPTAAAARAAKRRDIPYVITPRGMLVPELIAGRSRIAKSLWLRLVERRNFAGAAAIHFTTERERRDAERTAMPLPSPFVVPNGIELVARPNVLRDERLILAFGRISWKKRLELLIGALPNDATLTIAGNDEENLTPKLREQARTRGVEDRVTFLGEVNGNAKWELLARAAVVAMPSINENFGNVILEALSMQTPVVVTPEVGLSDDVRAAGAGLVVSGDQLGGALQQLLHDAPLRAEMGAHGRRLVEDRFTWPRVAEQMEDAYARLLQPQCGRQPQCGGGRFGRLGAAEATAPTLKAKAKAETAGAASTLTRDITPIVLARDEEPNIGRTLSQLSWAREVIVVDSMSTDATVSIARSFPYVRVVERAFDDLASQWNFALAQATSDWVLTLDADYFVPDEFVRELNALEPQPNVSAYEASFRYAVGGRLLRASLYPPRAVVLRRERCTNYMDGHTQRVRVDGDTLPLETPLVHDDRKSMTSFIARQRRYMRDEAAKIRRGEALSFASRIRKLRVVAPFAVVVHALFVKGLILDGLPGLRYAWERFIAELILSRELMR